MRQYEYALEQGISVCELPALFGVCWPAVISVPRRVGSWALLLNYGLGQWHTDLSNLLIVMMMVPEIYKLI